MKRPARISDILYSSIGGERLQTRLAELRVLREWAGVVGERVAQVTRPVSFRNGTLTVGVRGAVWRSEVEYLKEQIAGALNERMGRRVVSDIRLTSGYRGVQPVEPTRGRRGSLPGCEGIRVRGRQRRRIAHAVSSISDSELRESVAAAWESKKVLDERRRRAGWRTCRSCGQYHLGPGGICPGCAIDFNLSADGGVGGGSR